MATLTVAVDPEILKAAMLEAERRHSSVDQLVAEYLSNLAKLAESEPLAPGDVNEQLYAVRALGEYASRHPFRIDLGSFTRDDLHTRR